MFQPTSEIWKEKVRRGCPQRLLFFLAKLKIFEEQETDLKFNRVLKLERYKVKKDKPTGSSFGFLVPLPPYTHILCPHFPDWLLLQVSSRVFTEGDPLVLRCHGWKNMLVYKMLFYKDGKPFRFSHQDSEITIPKTNLSHNGIYHCSGEIRRLYTSAGVSITVKGTMSK